MVKPTVRETEQEDGILIFDNTIQEKLYTDEGVTGWLLDVPQHSKTSYNASASGNSSPAGISAVKWKGYQGLDSAIYGMPFVGPIQHWSDRYDKPLLGCMLHDPHYESRSGADLPVNEGTPIYTTMGGEVVWARENGL